MRVVVDEGAGPPVLLLHGQPGTAAVWVKLLPALLDRHLRVVAVDRPGYHGEPERARGFAGNAARIEVLLDELGLDQVLLVGHSWGGGVALRCALDIPARCAGLVLLASVGSHQAIAGPDRVLASRLGGRVASTVLSALPARLTHRLESSGGSVLTADDVELVRLGMHQWREIGAWEAFRVEQAALVRETPELYGQLATISPGIPVIVVQGQRDTFVPVAAGRDLAGRIPGARYVEIDAGHLLLLDQVPLVARLAAELAGTIQAEP
ncbi:MAG: alpha/beta fold hydrolase [Mycobacteriales bacterium]